MPSKLLLALAFAGNAGQAAALRIERGNCPERIATIVEGMTAAPDDAKAQMKGCSMLSRCVRSESKAIQNEAGEAGSLEASIAALRRFPDDKEVQGRCIGATARPILFNRENGLRAGQLGGLNLTLAAYRKWMDDPMITSHGGDIGCFLDYVDENRAILRELGGVHLLIQNIKNNFHGQYSDWGYNPVKNSLFGLSSGCWKNSDLCHEEGFIPLAIQLMNEHTSEDKIAEETLQAAKAMMFESDDYRREFSESGLAAALVKVLKENPNDRGAVSLACESVRFLVGPAILGGPSGGRAVKSFDAQAQATATREGLLEQLIATATSGATLHHKEHGGFNFNVDESYNAIADCQQALTRMGHENEANQQAMLKAGLNDLVVATMSGWSTLSYRAKTAGCGLLGTLNANKLNATAAESAAALLETCMKHRTFD